MKKYPCPSCGAEILFRTSIASHAVCPYCRTMVVRDDDALRKTGEMAQLPADISPFQIGTEGSFLGVRFGVVGRMKMGWEDGEWNEWFIVSDDARRGWLAEAQGFYAPCFETTDFSDDTQKMIKEKIKPLLDGTGASKLIDTRLRINQRWYRVVDIKEATCIGAEGELPFSAPKGRETVTVDLIAGDGLFASIEVTKDSVRVFEGAYVGWDDLKCKYYRTFEGW